MLEHRIKSKWPNRNTAEKNVTYTFFTTIIKIKEDQYLLSWADTSWIFPQDTAGMGGSVFSWAMSLFLLGKPEVLAAASTQASPAGWQPSLKLGKCLNENLPRVALLMTELSLVRHQTSQRFTTDKVNNKVDMFHPFKLVFKFSTSEFLLEEQTDH